MPRWIVNMLCGVLLCLCSAASLATTLRLCYEDISYPPYLNDRKDAAAGNPGFMIELLQQTADQLQLKFEYQRLPWKRCIHLLQGNQVDGIFPAIRRPDREHWGAFPSNPQWIFWPSVYSVFVANDSKVHWSGFLFSHIRHGIAGPAGHVATQKLHEINAAPRYPVTPKKGLYMVSRGRLDGYILEAQTGWGMAAKLGLSDRLKTLPTPFFITNLELLLSHRFYSENSKLSEDLWQTLNIIRQGPDQSLLDKYQIVLPEADN